ncbi:MAG TPA: hypothetical protein VJU86_18055 [Pyrinomonadaceae bacterium]|nr:hypothetical protein [Pyrinomonadaceae bacterium]
MKYLITLLVGLLIGAGAAIFLLGVPRAKTLPGTPVQALSGESPPSSIVVSLSDSFVNQLLATVFRDLGAPKFNLSSVGPGTSGTDKGSLFTPANFQGDCTNTVTLAQESGGVKTQAQFVNGNITAPLVFSGSYNLLGNCTQFKGWAQTSIQLSFDQPSQTVFGRVNVEGVNLEGVAPFANNFVTVFVRNAIDSKVNPLEVIRPTQLQLFIPVKASDGTVKAQVKDIKSEVKDGQLRLHVTYDFLASKGQQPAG